MTLMSYANETGDIIRKHGCYKNSDVTLHYKAAEALERTLQSHNCINHRL